MRSIRAKFILKNEFYRFIYLRSYPKIPYGNFEICWLDSQNFLTQNHPYVMAFHILITVFQYLQ